MRRLREFADEWQDPRHTSGSNPAVVTERWEQAERLHDLASQLVRRSERLETLQKAEMIVLVTCCLRMRSDDFARALMEYARDVVYVDADDLKLPAGLLRAFRR